MPGRDWVDRNVHYYDYSPDELKGFHDRDAKIIAEAWIDSEDQRCQLGIRVVVTGADLLQGVTREQAVQKGITVRDQLVERHREEAKLLKENRVLLYHWHGGKVE